MFELHCVLHECVFMLCNIKIILKRTGNEQTREKLTVLVTLNCCEDYMRYCV